MGDFKENKETEVLQVKPTFLDLESDIADIIRTQPHKGNVFDVVKWFVNLLEGQMSGEGIREVRTGKGQPYWLWPYAERMKRLTRQYYTLNNDFQQIIQAAREDEVYWRGDEMGFFMTVIDETEKMKSLGAVKYRKRALKMMKTAL